MRISFNKSLLESTTNCLFKFVEEIILSQVVDMQYFRYIICL